MRSFPKTNLIIRREKPANYDTVFKVIQESFKNEEFSNKREQFLVRNLRNSSAFVPELSLVAVLDDEIVGHILLTRIKIKNGHKETPSLALAPVTVLPKYQNRGIGSTLIEHAHQKARSLGYTSIILLGHPDYYPRFGYQKASTFGITLPFDVPDDHCMAIELTDDALKSVSGIVEYPNEFYSN